MKQVLKKQTLHACFTASGDKSITIRALLLGAIATGETVINNPLIAKDTLATIECVKKMGAQVDVSGNKIVVTGVKKINDGQIYDCQNSATLARLLIGILSGAKVNATITGDESLQKRPMERVCQPLINRGAKIEYNGLTLPVKISPSKLTDFSYEMQIDSAQVKSAIILSGVVSGNKTVVKEKNKTRDHTEKMLCQFGGNVSVNEKIITVENCSLKSLKGCEIDVPVDPSSSAFYLALGLLLGEVTVRKVLITALRAGFYEKLISAGANIKYSNVVETANGKVADITAYKSNLNYFEVQKNQMPSLIDELPVLSVLASFNQGALMIGAGELRKKESNRFQSVLDLINLAGGSATSNGDNLIISGKIKPNAFDYESNDHRMIMSAFVLMTAGNGGTLFGESCVDISFPSFFKNFENLCLGLIGKDLSKSKSGVMHKFILSHEGAQNFAFEQLSICEEQFDDFIKKCPYKAFNATIPYKTKLFLTAKNRSDNADKANSANYFYDGFAYTTDGEGLILSLEYNGISVKDKTILIYGLGGAGRSVAISLLNAGAKVFVKNRTHLKAEEFAKKVKGIEVYSGQDCEILINATSVKNDLLFENSELLSAKIIIDINYDKTLALEEYCKQNNKIFLSGLAMLFFQAYVSDCILLSKTVDKQRAFKLYKEYLVEYEN